MPERPVIVALDRPTRGAALDLARRLDPALCRVKVGLELFTAAGPGVIEDLMALGHEVFLDLKFHDIPNTVAAAVRSSCRLGVWMANVHALGGRRMLEAAVEARDAERSAMRLIAVTVLTSHAAAELAELGLPGTPEFHVTALAKLMASAGGDGVVCSPWEASALRGMHGAGFLLVTPGIRGVGEASADQRRTASAREAIAAGASHLVIGRPIASAPDPALALARLVAELGAM